MIREHNGSFSISSSTQPDVRRELYSKTKEAQMRAREIFRLQNNEKYKELESLFEIHNQEKTGETFLKPDDCPNDVWKQFCEDKIKNAKDQGLTAIQAVIHDQEPAPSSDIELVDEYDVMPVKLDKSATVLPVTKLLVTKPIKLNTIDLDADFVEVEKRVKMLTDEKRQAIRKSPDYIHLQNTSTQVIRDRLVPDQTTDDFIEKVFHEKSIDPLTIALFLNDFNIQTRERSNYQQKEQAEKDLHGSLIKEAEYYENLRADNVDMVPPLVKEDAKIIDEKDLTKVPNSTPEPIPSANIFKSSSAKITEKGNDNDTKVYNYRGGVSVRPLSRRVKEQSEEKIANESESAVAELFDDKKESVPETFYNQAELKVAADWLNEKVILSQEKNYADLRGKEREAADQRLLDNTKDVWQYFVKSEKWVIGKEENKVNIEDKGDIDAKITLGMLKQAGLEEKIYRFIKQQEDIKNQAVKVEKTNWSGLEIGEGGLGGFDQALSFPNQKACSAEVICKLLVAGGVYKHNDEAPRIAAEMAHRAIYNGLLTNKKEFENSDKTIRGLLRFFDYGNLYSYMRNNWPNIEGKNWAERFDNFLNRPLSQKDLEHYFVKKDDKGKNIIDYQKDQSKIIQQTKDIFKKPEAELITEGRIVESPIWGKIFINVMNSAKDSFPGGASSVGAYGVADAYLNIDLEKNSFLFRPFNELTKEQKAKLNLSGGQWSYNMYLKARGNKAASISKEEILKQLGVEEIKRPVKELSLSNETLINETENQMKSTELDVKIYHEIAKQLRVELEEFLRKELINNSQLVKLDIKEREVYINKLVDEYMASEPMTKLIQQRYTKAK
ncbi:MAG: hypothetical protein WC575_01415 [Patescibacteria group bacterium]